jgi:hypothetical protein
MAAVSTSIWTLAEGDRVRVVRDFQDFDGQRIALGRELVLLEKSYVPYDAGFTLKFAGGVVVRLSGDVPEQRAVVDNENDAYFVRVPS